MIALGWVAAASAAEDRPEKPEIELVESGPFRMKDKRGYRNLVVLGPRLFPPGIGGRYMRSVDDHLTVMVGGGYSGWQIFGVTAQHVDLRGGVDLEPLGNGLHGLYLGPRVTYRSFFGDISSGGESLGSVNTETLAIGAVAGWRVVIDPGLSFGAGLGASRITWVGGDDADVLAQEGDVQIVGIIPTAELTVGWAF